MTNILICGIGSVSLNAAISLELSRHCEMSDELLNEEDAKKFVNEMYTAEIAKKMIEIDKAERMREKSEHNEIREIQYREEHAFGMSSGKSDFDADHFFIKDNGPRGPKWQNKYERQFGGRK